MTLNHRQLQQNIFLILTSVLCDGGRVKSDGDGGTHFIYPTKNNKIRATVGHQATPWDKAKSLEKSIFPSRLLIADQCLHSRVFPVVPSLQWVPCPHVATFPTKGTIFSTRIIGLSSPNGMLKEDCENSSLTMGKEREQGKMFGFVCHCFENSVCQHTKLLSVFTFVPQY